VGLIRAFAEFNVGLEQEFKLVFVGSDKGNKEFLEELVAEYDLRDRVCFLGFVDREQLVSLYQNAVALVYPSFSGPENLPPLEAFALECPVVYSDFPGAREQLGDAALYFDPCSFQTILLSLRQIASDSALRTRLVQSGHERAMAWRCSDFVEGVVGAISKFKPIRDAWR
jgi:glycosyltransferase involved in cell wall biosynthesis